VFEIPSSLPQALSTNTSGYANTASGSNTGSHSPYIPVGDNASTSSTERCAINPDERSDDNDYAIGARAAIDELQALLDAAALSLLTFCKECDRRTPGLTSIDLERIRCAYLPPGKIINPKLPACTQWADPGQSDGLCIDHHRANVNAKRASRDRTLYHNGRTAP
jgi:hypothetical protein